MTSSLRLPRVLSLRDLVFYGIIIITPIAPVPIYGVAQHLSRGHMILCLVLAGVAMMSTAYSYGRMATLYPSAGSAYVYVGRGLHRHLGFLAGWAMILDYLVLPVVAIVQASLAMQRLVPSVPYVGWVTLFTLLITTLNLRGMRTVAHTNIALLLGMFVVIGAFLVLAFRYVLDQPSTLGFFSIQPFYHPDTFDFLSIMAATSFTALTYIGFDGVTALAEDVENPKRNVPLATVSICLFTTVFSCILVYFAELIWPDYRAFPNVETAFMDVTRQVGGPALFLGMGIVVILSSLGAGMAGQVAATRVPFAMGRDNALPPRFFAYLDPNTQNPTINIVFVSLVTWVGAILLNLQHAGQLLNFGAFLAFMGVNLAAIRQFYLSLKSAERRPLFDLIVPLLGFVFCLVIWLSLPRITKLIGGAWLLLGLAYSALRFKVIRPKMPQSSGYKEKGSVSTTTRHE